MQTNKIPQRREPERSLSWPPTLPGLHLTTTTPSNAYRGDSGSQSAVTQPSKPTHGTFEDDLDSYPENHFLSPIQMYEYEDWADDSDSEAEEIEWDAGITDFALFDNDRRQAQESNKPVPSKWTDMLAQQASALQRAVQRNQEDPNSDPVNRSLAMSDTELPNLTPDDSPDLRDDLDIDAYHSRQAMSRPSVPHYLTISVSPPEDDEDGAAVEEDEDLPLTIWIARKQQRDKSTRKLQRPGMRHSRTMSGQVHAWRRPSWHMYTLGEDSEAEDRAETEDSDAGGEIRGRK
jgi:hypothetical protein